MARGFGKLIKEIRERIDLRLLDSLEPKYLNDKRPRRSARKRRKKDPGVTQSELGGLIGQSMGLDAAYAQTTISQWERGSRLPEIRKLLVMLKMIDVDIDECKFELPPKKPPGLRAAGQSGAL